MNLVRQFFIYGLGGAASRLAAVILVPLYTRALSIDQYGQLELLLAVHALAIILGGLQSESALARDYHDADKRGELKSISWTAVIASCGGTLLVVLAALLLSRWNAIPENVGDYLPLLLAMTLPAQLLGIQMVLLRFSGAAAFYSAISFLDLTLCALCSAFLIVVLDWGISGALTGILLSKTLCCALTWPKSFGKPNLSAGFTTALRSMLTYSVPTLPAVILSWLQNAGNRVILAATLTLSDVAVAGVAMKIAALYGFVIYSFRLAWEPFGLAQLLNIEKDPGVYRRAFDWYVITMFAAAGLTTMLSPTIVEILAPGAYAAGGQLASFFIAGQFWTGAISVLSIGIHGARVTSKLTNVYSFGAITNVVVLFAFAPYMGVISAGLGFMFGSAVSAMLALHFSERFFCSGFSRKTVYWSFVGTLLFASGCSLLQSQFSASKFSASGTLAQIAGGSVLLMVTMALIVWQGFSPGRLRSMWQDARTRITAT